MLIPWLSVLYLLSFLDRTVRSLEQLVVHGILRSTRLICRILLLPQAIGNAQTFGLSVDLKMTDQSVCRPIVPELCDHAG